MRIEPILFLPWGEAGIPERFQSLPQSSVSPILGAPPAGNQRRSEVQVKAGEKGMLLLRSENEVFVAGHDAVKSRISTLPNEAVVDFEMFQGKVYVLVRNESTYLLRSFGLDGEMQNEMELATDEDHGGYHQLLKSHTHLYLVGKEKASTTFLGDPVLFLFDDGQLVKVHHWKDERFPSLFMDAQGKVYYTKDIDRLRYWATFDLESKRETIVENFAQSSFPHLGLPIGIDPAGRCIGRSGFSVALIGKDNAPVWEVAMRNLFRQDGKTWYTQQQGEEIVVYAGKGNGFAAAARFNTEGEWASRHPGLNWNMGGFDPEGHYLLFGKSSRAPAPVLAALDEKGEQAYEVTNGGKALVEMSHRLMPPAMWDVNRDGVLLAASLGPDGVTVFGIEVE